MLKTAKMWWLVCVAVVASFVLCALPAFAADRVTLKNGTVVEGTILREAAGVVWIKDASGKERMLLPSEITSIARGAAEKPAEVKPADGSPAAVKPTEATAPGSGGGSAVAPLAVAPAGGRNRPKAAVITLGERGDKDMVGLFMTRHQLDTIRPMLEQDLGTDGTGIVVFRITSGGGALLEIQRLSDAIQLDYKPRFKVVAWIDSAISAAAMTAHAIEDIYFTSQGNYGACTGWFGQLQAVKGRELVEVIEQMKKISARGNHDPKIMESMQIMRPLSVKIDGDTPVFFHDTVSGDFVVNPENRILTLNAETAKKIRFSRGTADNLEELTKAMGFENFEDIEWIGEKKPGYLWPISKAEQWSMDYRSRVKRDQDSFNNYWQDFNQYIAAAASVELDRRGPFVSKARAELDKIRAMMRNNPNFLLFNMNMLDMKQFNEWYDEQDRRLKELMRR
jgi:hypothetical protein